MKIEKISKMALYICVGIILVSFGAFLTIGYDNPMGDYNEPQLTDVIMWLMYLLVAATSLLTLWSVVRSIQCNKGNDSSATTGVPGGKITLVTIGLLILSLAVGYGLGIGEADFTASDGTVTAGSWVTIVDAFCVSIAILMVAAAAAVVVSMTGILTKNASK